MPGKIQDLTRARTLLAAWESVSLRTKVTLFLTVYIAGTIAVVSGVVLHLENQRVLVEARGEADAILRDFAKTLYGRWNPLKPSPENRKSLEESGIRDQFYNKPNIAYSAFQDSKGRLLYIPRRIPTFGWILDRTTIDAVTRRKLAITGSATRTFYDEPEGAVVEYLIQIRGKNEKPMGVVRLGLREARIRHTLDESTRQTLWKLPLLIVSITLVSALIVFLLAAYLESPIRALHLRARQLLGDKGDSRDRKDSLAQLHQEFEGIEKMVQGLKQNRTELVGTISHDLRSPIQSIMGYIYFLRHGGAGPLAPEVERYLGLIDENAEHFGTFIDNVLDLVRLDRNRLQLQMVPIAVPELVQKSVDLFRPKAVKDKLKLAVAVEPDAASAVGDAGRVLQVLANLIANAMKFTPSGGTITVGAVNREDSVELFVSDSGPGIPKEKQALVFQEFYQVPDTDPARGPKGLGIGLTLCQRLIEAQGGRIWAEGEPGKGATIRFTLPRQKVSVG